MSHKATSWLAQIPADQISSSEFRVLFHLCDCHNPSQGCFPTQAYLLRMTGVSNGTLNNALNSLEAKRLIVRHRSVDSKTRRKRPTRYILGCDPGMKQEPSPKTGDGKSGEKPACRLQSAGDGADSNSDPKPTPIYGQSRLQPTGDKPVKEPVRNRARDKCSFDDRVRFWAETIRKGGFVVASAITARMARRMLELDLVSEADLSRHQISW